MGLVRYIARRLDRSLSSPSTLSKRTPEGGEERLTSGEIGALGERLTERFLRFEHGYRVLRHNFKAPERGEVDIVCRDGDTLAFVEVKTRTGFDPGDPADAVDRAKESLITRGALHWLRLLNHPEILFRFDVVEVLLDEGEPPRLNLIRGAFELPEPIRY